MMLAWLFRGSLILLAGYITLAIALRLLRPQQTFVRQAACGLVLLAAWQPFAWEWKVAWYPAPEVVAQEELPPASDLQAEPPTSPPAIPAATQAPEPPPATRPHIRLPRLQWSALWSAGIAALLLHGTINYVLMLRRLRRSQPPPLAWQREWEQVCREARVSNPIPLRITADLGPMLGLLPRGFAVLLPQTYWQNLGPAARQAVLRHELAHYVRGDVFSTLAFRLLALPFWFHPAAWRLSAWFEEAAEDACDRAAVRGGEPVAFARALEQLLTNVSPSISPTLGRCARSHPLVARVRRVLSPIPSEDSLMKTSLVWAAAALVAVSAAVKIQLVAQEPGATTLQSVKDEQGRVEARLRELKSTLEGKKADDAALKARVDEVLNRIKSLPSKFDELSDEIKRRGEQFKSGGEAEQLRALDGVEKLNDEGLMLLAHAAKEGSTEKVRAAALAAAIKLGEPGLAVVAHAFEALSTNEKVALVENLAKAKQPFNVFLFARVCKSNDEQVRAAALTAGLETEKPLVFFALAADGADGVAEAILARSGHVKGDELQSLLYALAWKGPESLLPPTIRKAAELKSAGYPVIAAAYQRNTPEARAEIVRLFKKSTVQVERDAVQAALNDSDPALKEAAEKANAE